MSDPERMQNKSVRVDAHLWRWIGTLAEHWGVKRSVIMRKAMDLGVARLKKQMRDDEIARRDLSEDEEELDLHGVRDDSF